ncbi:hypothetical protein HETIRDRAFT_478665 [Heterobasidion irregulare TC 32-1]|uniref:Transcription factor IIIC putative zinc-finger domain-containing protein n=1 Tax=Heterobasidion irregulare (strain TC 32-1) TaxID=747525 RepID=W4K1P2_HETIT|nr:uncharacterized protein HETIRDRAFT_478665 [Heterobasidion irregulare TC 32-1]ETW79260.1 hypothetical protein HETIRDRAFT_478665 [Heterobasidion irregulare TC 32-1]
MTVHDALTIPAAGSQPSINCLQWTNDGQILFLTKTAIYIITPDAGINFDSSSTIKASKMNDDAAPTKPLSLFRTMIEYDRIIACHWPVDSQEWSAVVLGSLDLALRSVSVSPSNITADAGCVLAIINSNLELSLWVPLKNHLNGKWVKLQDVTPFLKSLAATSSTSMMRKTLQAQATCSAWSAQSDFGVIPSHCDGSLLAVGNKVGSIVLLRFQESQTGALEHVNTIDFTEQCITAIAWSPWRLLRPYTCSALIACSSSDGSILLASIMQTLRTEKTSESFAPRYRIEVQTQILAKRPESVDKRGITGVTWIAVLVYCKPGTVHLWSNVGLWSGLRSFKLRTQKTSAGASSLHPVTGITYHDPHDFIVLSLFDGSFHVIYEVSSEPTLETPVSGMGPDLSSWALSSSARAVFLQSEKQATEDDMGRMSGMISYDEASTVAWVHESCCPSDFSYKHEAKHDSVFVVAEMWTPPGDDMFMEMLLNITRNSSAAAGHAPIHILRPIFLHLQKTGKISQLQLRLLETLRDLPVDESTSIAIPPFTREFTADVRTDFGRSLTQHLFGFNTLLSLRLLLAIADFCWKYAPNPEAQGKFGLVAQSILESISHRVLRALIRHLAAITTLLTKQDTSFLLRVVLQSLLPGTPEDLSTEAHQLSNTVNALLPPGNDQEGSSGLEETCPACGIEVALDNIASARCANGHMWARCSITSFILATPMVRTCVGCTRKAFLPPGHPSVAERPAWLPPAAQSWVVEALLGAVRRCLFCGNSFVSLI